MNILLLGATDAIGSRILNEAVQRGHHVTAVARHAEKLQDSKQVKVVSADAGDAGKMQALMQGQDAVVSSLSPRGENGVEQYLAAIRSILQAAEASPIGYALFVGGMSNIKAADGERLLDKMLPTVPETMRPELITVAKAREMIEKSNVNWSFFCPGGMIEPGQRTGKFRLGGETALFQFGEKTRISMEDYAVAVLDELEHPQYEKQVFHICY